MKCPKCGSENVRNQILYNNNAFLNVCLYKLLKGYIIVLTFGKIQIHPVLLTYWKHFPYWKAQSLRNKVTVCQNCSFGKKIYDKNSLLNSILIWIVVYMMLFPIVLKIITLPPQVIKKTQQTNQTISENEIRYQQFKEKGTLAISEDRLSEGINLVKKAIELKTDLELENTLDKAYFERAEFYFSMNKFDLALNDINKIKVVDGNIQNLKEKIQNKLEKEQPIKVEFEVIGHLEYSNSTGGKNRLSSVYVKNFRDDPAIWIDIENYAKQLFSWKEQDWNIVFFYNDRENTPGDIISNAEDFASLLPMPEKWYTFGIASFTRYPAGEGEEVFSKYPFKN